MDNVDIFSDDYKVSVYNGVRDTTGVVVTLATFLTDTKHQKEIEQDILPTRNRGTSSREGCLRLL